MHRRDFLKTTGAVALAGLRIQPATTVKTVRTPILEIAYHEYGPATGFPVILLHGFPDDAHAYDGVGPILASAGHRAFSVFLRGYAPTRFLDRSQPRTAEQAAIGQDVIDFADALQLPKFAVAGFDWGGRAAAVAGALHPDRVAAAVLMGGYSIQNTVTPGRPGSPEAARRGWYQWYLNTEVGRAGLEQNRKALCEALWREWSPTWKFTPAEYALTAQSFDSPDFVDCVIHSYRHRNFNAPGEPRFIEIEKKLAGRPPLTMPVITLHGGDDAFGTPSAEISAGERTTLPKLIDKRIVQGAGHFVPHEKPEPVARAIIDVLKLV